MAATCRRRHLVARVDWGAGGRGRPTHRARCLRASLVRSGIEVGDAGACYVVVAGRDTFSVTQPHRPVSHTGRSFRREYWCALCFPITSGDARLQPVTSLYVRRIPLASGTGCTGIRSFCTLCGLANFVLWVGTCCPLANETTTKRCKTMQSFELPFEL